MRKTVLLLFLFLCLGCCLSPLAAQQPSDLFKSDRFSALYLDLVGPYEIAVKFLQNIDAPENAQYKAALENVYDMSIKNFTKARSTARSKACAANMRVLLGGVEMYNMDHKDTMGTKLDINTLVNKKYMKSAPVCPEGGEYSAEGDLSGEGFIKCSVHGTPENLVVKSDDKTAEKGADKTLQDWSKELLAFHEKGLFRPVGGIYLAVSTPDLPGLGVVVEASSKPQELVDFLRETVKAPIPEPVAKEGKTLVFSFPAALPGINKPAEIRLTEKGLIFSAFQEGPKNNVSHWDTFQQTAKKDGNSLVLEILPTPIIGMLPFMRPQVASSKACAANMRVMQGAVEMYNMDHAEMMKKLDAKTLVEKKYLKSEPVCPNGGVYSEDADLSGEGLVKCSIHNTVPNLKTEDLPQKPNQMQQIAKEVQVLRLVLGEKACMLIAGIKDAQARKQLKEMLEKALPEGRKMAQQIVQQQESQMSGQLDAGQQQFLATVRGILDSVSIIEKSPWIGFRTKGIPSSHAIIPVTGILAAIAIPNFRKARDNARQKACFANQRVLTGAMEMYYMDNEQPMTKLDMQKLVQQKYLHSVPICPDGGNYSLISLEKNKNGELVVKCSKHGSFEQF